MSAPVSFTSFDFGGGPPPALTPVHRPPLPPDTPPGLARRMRESFAGYPLDPLAGGIPYALFDDAPNWPAGWGHGTSGTVADRKAGKDLPRFWSELDLRGYRVMSRWLWDTNPFMLGFGARLVDYHVGRGYQWQACLTGQAKQPYATAAADHESPAGRLTAKAQTVLDEWRDRVGWPLRAREGFRRLRRDGEVIQRFGRGGPGRLPWVRWVNPEQVGSPTGDANTDGSFGVRTAPDDTEHVAAVFVRDHDGDGSAGAWVNADRDDPRARVLFFKTNTDADVKRGLPDSFSVGELLDESRKLVRNMVVAACAQAAVAWLEKFPTAGADQVRALIPTGAPRLDVPPWLSGGQPVYSEKLAAGTVLRTEGSREFAPGPVGTGVGSFVDAEQAALRAVCVRWGFPPYLTAKADDINFASSLTAGSPFAVAVEGGQVEWAAVERATALKVLDLAVESGRLTPGERRRLDVEVIAPTVTSPDPGAETARNKTLFDAKVLDPYTWMQREGLDPSHVEANWKAWHARNPEPAPPGAAGGAGPGGQPGAPPAGGLGESIDGPSRHLSETESGKPPPGKVWKDVTVTRNGKTFKQRRLVNASAAAIGRRPPGRHPAATPNAGDGSGGATAGASPPPPPPPPPPPASPSSPLPGATPGPRTRSDFVAEVQKAAGDAPFDPAGRTENDIRAVEQVLVAAAGDGGSVAAHGMSSPEKTRSIEIDGVAVHWPDTPAGLRQAALSLPGIAAHDFPAAVWNATSRIVFTTQQNKDDAKWAKRYNMPGFTSAATGGDGTVVRYNGKPLTPRILAHEAGHRLARLTWGAPTPDPQSEYGKAQAAEPPVSSYAVKSGSPAEDFAEAVALYCEGPVSRASLKAKAPKKYAALETLLGVP